MTIYHPRVGYDIQSVTSAGTDASSATQIAISVGKTLIFVTGSGGLGGDGVLMPDMDVGNEVELRPVTNQSRIYFPAGATVKGLDGSSVTTLYVQALNSGGIGTQLIKTGTSEWHVNV